MTRRTSTIPRFLATLACIAAAAAQEPAHAQTIVRSRIDTTYALAKGAWVDLSLPSGQITVTGWTRPEVRIIARIDNGQLEATLTESRVFIQTRSRQRHTGDSHYELMVPIGTRVQATSASGDIRVKATAGEVLVNTASGDVEVLDAVDRIEVRTSSGSVHAAKLRGRVRIFSSSGDLQVEDVAGDVNTQTVSGEITVRGATSSQVRAETTSGEITYVGSIEASGSYDFSSHSGDVRLTIPSGAGANLQMETYSGNIHSAFPMTLQPGAGLGRRRGKRMEFTIGNGGARISVETFSGDITIERSSRSGKEE
jgi:hypothetical protein